MATIQSGGSPGTRVETGDAVLEAAETTDTTPIAARLTAFKKIHGAYCGADQSVKKTSLALEAQQRTIAECDVTQDIAVDDMAIALPNDGLPRVNPFKPFGAPSPSVLKSMGTAKQAETLIKLAGAVLKRKGLSQRSIDAAKAADQAAREVLAAIKPIAKHEKARTDAMSRRAAIEQAWETAFASLKRGARAAEDEGYKGLFAALFERPAKRKSPSKSKTKAPAAAAKPS